MATSNGMLAEERVVFDCPRCGVHHDGPLTIETESEFIDEDMGLPGGLVAMFTRTTFRTSAWGDVFVTRSIVDEPTFEMSLLSFEEGRPSRLHVVPKNVSQR
jgi:hypothetical protein